MTRQSMFDIFVDKFRSEISPERLFVYRYNSLFHVLEFDRKIDLNKTVEFFRQRFNLSTDAILHSYEALTQDQEEKQETVDEEIIDEADMVVLEDDQKVVQIIMELPGRILVSFDNDNIKFVFADIKQAEMIRALIGQLPRRSERKYYKKKFYMIYYSRFEHLSLKSFKVKEVDVSVEDYYNDDFVEVDHEIKEFLMDNKRDGIILLHGAVGTGKTTYIRHLMRSLNKRFIFLPPALAHKISSPEILEFMSMLSDSVLIMEDCEDLIKPRGGTGMSNDALVNLLNLGDGLLADALNIKIICTFNADVHKIDPALVRKGRLAVEYEFRPLEVEKAQQLAKKLGMDIEITRPMTLADFFVQKQVVRKSHKHQTLGFQRN